MRKFLFELIKIAATVNCSINSYPQMFNIKMTATFYPFLVLDFLFKTYNLNYQSQNLFLYFINSPKISVNISILATQLHSDIP